MKKRTRNYESSKSLLNWIIVFIFYFSQVIAQTWSEPEKLPPPINTKARSSYPFITPDGKRMYFCSDRDYSGTEDIYYSDWLGTNWAEPVRLGPHINTIQRELSPSVTADGKFLYFNRYTTRNSYDIYYCTLEDTGWSKPLNIGPPINTSAMEFNSCISATGDTLLFDCGHYWETMYPPDLCMSFKTDTGWTFPQLVFENYEGNRGWENAPKFANNGKAIYFHTARTVATRRDIYFTEFNGKNWHLPIALSGNINTPEAEMSPFLAMDGTLYFARIDNVLPDLDVEKIYVSHNITGVEKNIYEGTLSPIISCYPNPFNIVTNLHIDLQQINKTTITIYDINGKEVKQLYRNYPDNASLHLQWNGTDSENEPVSSGIYFCQIILGENFSQTIKIMLVK